jgi:cysteine desulfurase
MNVIYLDNNATTGVSAEVIEAMLPYYGELYGNPSSIHAFGSQIHHKVDEARQMVAEFIHADSDEIVFTSCGTESDNTAIMSALLSNPQKKHIITTSVEHHAVLNFCKEMSKRGYEVSFLPVDPAGQIDLNELESAITENTVLVSIMYANNETGVIFPMDKIAEIVKSRNILLHTDAVQAAAKIPINVNKLPIDMLAISGHKMHAPKGVGALYIRKGLKFSPYLIGGGQEKGRRAGTENVASIVGLGRACELAKKHLLDDQTRIKSLRDRLEEGLLKTCHDSRVNGDREKRLPNTTNMSFEYVEGEAILLRLNEDKICASAGSACASVAPEPSHVLKAMGVPSSAIHGSIRFSLSPNNTEKDIDIVLQKMPGIIRKLREISPIGRKKNTF